MTGHAVTILADGMPEKAVRQPGRVVDAGVGLDRELLTGPSAAALVSIIQLSPVWRAVRSSSITASVRGSYPSALRPREGT
jgi:hypothetical protein